MIKHVVFFKFKPESDSSDRKSALEALRALPAKINAIRKFEVGENIIPQARAWDAVLIAEYDDLKSLDEYTVHPDHQALIVRMGAVCQSVASVDYEF
ncbi:MAG TPA: Dabb family protein [Blastocatellia bacterium]